MRQDPARVALSLGVVVAMAAAVVVYRTVSSTAGPTGPVRLVRTFFVGRHDSLGPLAFSRDGRTLATAGVQTVYLVDRATGRADAAWTAPKGTVLTSLALGAGGRMVAFSTDGATRRPYLLDVRAGTVQALPPVPNNESLENIAFSLDGQTLAVGSNDVGITYLFDTVSRRISGTVRAPATWAGAAPVAFSPDSRTLAIGDGLFAEGRRRGQIGMWDVAGRKLRATVYDPDRAGISALAFSPDGRVLAVGAGRHIFLWDLPSGQRARTLTGPRHSVIGDLAFSPDSRMLAVILVTGHGAYLWNLGTGRLVATMPDPGGTEVNSIAYSPDGKTVGVGDYDGDIFMWDVSRAEQASKTP